MARNLIIIIGLSLAVVALGCPDGGDGNGDGGAGGEGGSGGEVGMGGGGGSGGAPSANACLNESDMAMVCDPNFGTNYVGPCATTALGQGAATSTCLQEDAGLSEPCADCYGDVTQCTFDNCVAGDGGSLDGPCAPPNEPDSAGCLACRDSAGCDAAGDACTGDLANECIDPA